MNRLRVAYLFVLPLVLGSMVACGPSPAEDARLKTAVLVKSTPVDNGWQVRSGQTALYWHEGDLWRSKDDGSSQERLTQERLFDAWIADPGSDPWWIGGPPPQPFVSPDGRWLVATIAGKKFTIIDLSGVEPARQVSSTAHDFSWSPDSRYIAYGRDKIDIFDAAAGQLLEGYTRRPGDVTDIVWSPDGLEIAFACCFRPDEQQAGEEVGDIYRYRFASTVAELDGATWRGVASGTPGLCWVAGRPIPADRAVDRAQCSPMRPTPSATSADGLWRAELGGYSPEENLFTELLITEELDDRKRLLVDLSRYEPPLDLRRVFWIGAGEALLLGDYWAESAIYRLDLAGNGELAPIMSDGLLLGVIPQWDLAH